jgi:hypothetical protein
MAIGRDLEHAQNRVAQPDVFGSNAVLVCRPAAGAGQRRGGLVVSFVLAASEERAAV